MAVKIAFVTAALLLAAPAAAQDIPRFDVPAYCLEVASVGGTYSASTEQGCFRLEQAAYDELKPVWAGLPATMREYCVEVATVGGPGSYSTLSGCIALESRAAAQPKTFKY